MLIRGSRVVEAAVCLALFWVYARQPAQRQASCGGPAPAGGGSHDGTAEPARLVPNRIAAATLECAAIIGRGKGEVRHGREPLGTQATAPE
jgi:hypothetical protein